MNHAAPCSNSHGNTSKKCRNKSNISKKIEKQFSNSDTNSLPNRHRSSSLEKGGVPFPKKAIIPCILSRNVCDCGNVTPDSTEPVSSGYRLLHGEGRGSICAGWSVAAVSSPGHNVFPVMRIPQHQEDGAAAMASPVSSAAKKIFFFVFMCLTNCICMLI